MLGMDYEISEWKREMDRYIYIYIYRVVHNSWYKWDQKDMVSR